MAVSKLYLGSDHAGFSLKQTLFARLQVQFLEGSLEDCGTGSQSSCDYPEFAERVALLVTKSGGRGILVCGTGAGMAIAANKYDGIRASVAWDVTSARLSRQHNDSNILCLGARLMGQEVAFDAVAVWLATAFEGGRHQKRVEMITQGEVKRR